jgi:hypothetical protein
MTGKVYGLNGQLSHRSAEPCESTILELEAMLERARDGELQGFAAAVLTSNNTAEYHLAGRVGGFAMQGALECAKVELTHINLGLTE